MLPKLALFLIEKGKNDRSIKIIVCYKFGGSIKKALADYNENSFNLAAREVTFTELYEK